MKLLALTLAATALLFARDANAIDTDFPGFQHFHNWDGQYVNNKEVVLPYHGMAPLGVAKDWCAADTKCGAFGSGGHDFFWQLNTTTEFDVYFGITGENGTAPAAMCSIEPGGGNLPDTHWLACTAWELSTVINKYQLPPDDIRKACIANPKCIGFRVHNDWAYGELIGKPDDASGGWVKVS
jgi:hypothetical protein